MDQEIKQKWCDALRSGKYKQGKSYMYNEKTGTYCCLGVLEFGVLGRPVHQGIGLSGEVFELTEITSAQENKCMLMNDGETYTDPSVPFPKIADYIEANL